MITHIGKEAARYNRLFIYPNPSEGTITVSHKGDQLKYNVLNIYGKKLSTGMVSGDPATIDLNALANGIYMVDCYSGGNRYINKIIIQK
jgi:hypothetical protein